MENRVRSQEAAALIGVTRRRIQQLTKAGVLSSHKIGREHTYKPEQLREEFSAFSADHPNNESNKERGRQRKIEKARSMKGARVGSLTIGDVVGLNSYGEPLLSCRCDCGKIRTIILRGVASRKYNGCGPGCSVRKYKAKGQP